MAAANHILLLESQGHRIFINTGLLRILVSRGALGRAAPKPSAAFCVATWQRQERCKGTAG